MKYDVKRYNPYVYLDLNDSTYEEEVINYYNSYKEIHNNNYSFRKRVIRTNDEEVDRLIFEFLNNDGNIVDLITELRVKIRMVKNIILITEDAKITKKHIENIDNKVNKAITTKNKQYKMTEMYMDKLYSYIDDFISDDKLYSESLSQFKTNIQRLISKCEKIYSVNEFNSITKKINLSVDKAIDMKAKKNYVYKYYDVKFKQIIDNYKNVLIVDDESFSVWVNNLKNDYNEFKRTIMENFPSSRIEKVLKVYDEKIDRLIDINMIPDMYINDERTLRKIFEDYYNTILTFDDELKKYDYYEYMTESEKFNIKREIYENMIRIFKGNIRNFNRNIRLKYSKSYASKYIDGVNKSADVFIIKHATKVGMPVPKNPWIVRKYLWADTENFVSDNGIKIRKIINKPLQKIVRLAMKNKLIIEEMPKYDKNKQYVFISTHYFTEDVIGLFSATDRQTHMLMGTTDQIENNPLMLAAMLFGFFHVDRMDSDDRKECFEKQNILIDKGTSFINYIGGSWENSENELQPLSFSGAYRTSKMKDVLIIPVSSYLVREDKKIYMRFGEALDVRKYDEQKANEIIRDTLAMMHYKQISKYSYLMDTVEIKTDDKNIKTHNLPYNQHIYYMDQIGDEYWNQPWTKPFAKEEIGVRKSKISTEEEVYGFVSNLSREKLIELSKYLGDVMVKIEEKERYDIVKYLDSNYDKFKKRCLKKK